MRPQLVILSIFFVCLVSSSDWILKDLRIPRVRPAVAQVGNKIYIAGGEVNGGVETDSIEVINTDRYELEEVDIRLPSPRQRFTAVSIGSKIFFSGGSSDSNNKIDVLDTSNNMWSVLTVSELSNVNITFAGVLDNQLVLTTGDGMALFIDPQSGQVATSLRLGNFTGTAAAVPPTRTFLQAAQYNGRLYVAYGATIIHFNTTSYRVLPLRSDSLVVINHMLVLEQGKYEGLYITDITANQFFFYAINQSKWDARLLSGRRSDHSIASVGTTVYITGGSAIIGLNGSRTDYQTGFEFDTVSTSLGNPIDLKAPRSQATPFVAPNAAIFIGGMTDDGKYSSTIDIIYEGELAPPTVPSSPATSPSNVPQLHVTSRGGRSTINRVVLMTVIIVLVSLFN